MKTQEFKNNESIKPVNLILLVLFIIFFEILLTGNKTGDFKDASKEFFSMDFVIPKQQMRFSEIVPLGLEKEKLYLKTKLNEEAIKSENEKIKDNASEINFSMAKMREYLIAADEPEMEIKVAKSIAFQEENQVDLIAQEDLETVLK